MKRSKFSLSHYKLLTCDMGKLVPCGMLEVLPGDSIQQSTSALVRVSPLLAPVMHPVSVRIHHWFVPHRLVWDNWEDFITGGPDGMNSNTVPVRPGTFAKGTFADYIGVPPDIACSPSALPARGYGLIWNEWYRDQDLQTPLPVDTGDGPDDSTNQGIAPVCWEKDYFTSSRPWTQKGPEITVPLGGTAPVTALAGQFPTFNVGGQIRQLRGSATGVNADWDAAPGVAASATWSAPGLQADLSNATSANINDLRKAFALQRYEEARARYGSRYTEYLRYLGVRSSDARLQRPEYLGGGKQTIQFSEVLQTSPVEADGVVGTLKGHGIGAMRSNRYRRFFEEHGYVFSLLSVLPKTMYVQGLPRTLNRVTKEDFFQKELQGIGQQEILNKEVFTGYSGVPTPQPNGVFGYQDRYDEYRRQESSVAGEFRNTLDFWHYARIFTAPPALNASFVGADVTKRVNAEQTSNVLWVMCNHSIQARRIVNGSAQSFIY